MQRQVLPFLPHMEWASTWRHRSPHLTMTHITINLPAAHTIVAVLSHYPHLAQFGRFLWRKLMVLIDDLHNGDWEVLNLSGRSFTGLNSSSLEHLALMGDVRGLRSAQPSNVALRTTGKMHGFGEYLSRMISGNHRDLLHWALRSDQINLADDTWIEGPQAPGPPEEFVFAFPNQITLLSWAAYCNHIPLLHMVYEATIQFYRKNERRPRIPVSSPLPKLLNDALAIAVQWNRFEAAEYLLGTPQDSRPDVNAGVRVRNMHGPEHSSLCEAVVNRNVAMVKLLATHGASMGNTFPVTRGFGLSSQSPLHCAVRCHERHGASWVKHKYLEHPPAPQTHPPTPNLPTITNDSIRKPSDVGFQDEQQQQQQQPRHSIGEHVGEGSMLGKVPRSSASLDLLVGEVATPGEEHISDNGGTDDDAAESEEEGSKKKHIHSSSSSLSHTVSAIPESVRLRLEIIRLLAASGANLNLYMKTHQSTGTPLEEAVSSSSEFAAPCVALLLELGADPKVQNPLHRASSLGAIHLVRMLLDAGAPVNHSTFPTNETALQVACEQGHMDVVKLLVERGASLSERHYGKTPMHGAITSGKIDAVKMLLHLGATVTTEAGGTTPVELPPLHLAAHQGHDDIVLLLLEHGAEISELGGTAYFTPLHVAASQNRGSTVRILIDAGADIYAKDRYGATPRDVAWDAKVKKLLEGKRCECLVM